MVDWKSVTDGFKSYAANVGISYLAFVMPVAIFFAFNSAADTMVRDGEKYGVLWLHYNSLEPEERQEKFPEFRPGSQQAQSAAAM